MVHEIVYVDPNICVYEIRSLLNTNDKIARFKIKNDRDVQYVLGEGRAVKRASLSSFGLNGPGQKALV